MDYKKLRAKVNNPKTTSKWIEEQIEETDDIKALRILATSQKVSGFTLETLYLANESDYKLSLAIARNKKSPGPVLASILKFALERLDDKEWEKEYCWEIIDALHKNPKTPKGLLSEAEYARLESNWEKAGLYGPDDYDEDEDEEDYEYSEEECEELLELMGAFNEDNQ